MNQEKPHSLQEDVFEGINGLSEDMRTDLINTTKLIRLKPGEDPLQSRQNRIKQIAMSFAKLPNETVSQYEERAQREAESIVVKGDVRVDQLSGYLKMLVDFEKAFKEHGTERELRASPESAERIKSMLSEFGPGLKARVEDLARNLENSYGHTGAEYDKKELAKAQSKLAALKKLAVAADLEF